MDLLCFLLVYHVWWLFNVSLILCFHCFFWVECCSTFLFYLKWFIHFFKIDKLIKKIYALKVCNMINSYFENWSQAFVLVFLVTEGSRVKLKDFISTIRQNLEFSGNHVEESRGAPSIKEVHGQSTC